MIDRFDGEHRFLSNFFPSSVLMYGEVYRTVEHAYQAAKSLDDDVRRSIRMVDSPRQAKKIGRKIALRPDWDDFRLIAMRTLVRRKFSNPILAKKLLDTAPHELVEGNYWGDRFWGVCRGEGANHLGRILMDVRAELESGRITTVEDVTEQ